ncbi:hypothetical protein [Aquirhabdus parva]|uniref:Uncharacterized protein n=1 Tax=Aquirhabdus parva TaxID=2283318 RepID=A0A345P4N0_9GAMM|nr:hypothetical protein [Aquirhabdus parva]AXI02239.1 hypothetical protein HYN46_04930 [Aquirhabdus parva]
MSGTITEFYYTPQIPNFDKIRVNNPFYLSNSNIDNINFVENTTKLDNTLQLIANNIVVKSKNYMFEPLSPDTWSGYQWTGLEPLDRTSMSQQGLGIAGSLPSYGQSLFQKNNSQVGIQLNTFPPDQNTLDLPTKYTAASMQYFIGFTPSKKIWLKSDLLCMSGKLNLASSYSAGSVNQVMMTMRFYDTISTKGFFLNVMLYDSRAYYEVKDIIHIDQQDTGNPIIISHAQNQSSLNHNVLYTSPIIGYANPLTPVSTGALQSGSRDYGFCISAEQFSSALGAINLSFTSKGLPQSSLFSTDKSRYVLEFALVGPEIETSGGRGRLGMTINELWIYRLSP